MDMRGRTVGRGDMRAVFGGPAGQSRHCLCPVIGVQEITFERYKYATNTRMFLLWTCRQTEQQ